VEQFKDTKERWHKNGGVTAYHVIQSFAEGEVDAETAHEIGVKLAEEMFGDRFEVVVATHLKKPAVCSIQAAGRGLRCGGHHETDIYPSSSRVPEYSQSGESETDF
jgi:hypothetical protein